MILLLSLASLFFRSVIILTLTLIGTVTVTVSAHSSLPIFDITTYGAIPDNTTLCTSSIQAAIDAAYAIGGGIVFIPSGGAFRTATISLRDNVYLHLPAGATIQAVLY